MSSKTPKHIQKEQGILSYPRPALKEKYRSSFPFTVDNYAERYIKSPLDTKRSHLEYDRKNSPANYNFLGFHDENELYSSDLNEIQEINHEQRSLLAETVFRWGYYQGFADETDAQNYTQTLKTGVLRQTKSTTNEKIHNGGPFWNGATPVNPKLSENERITKFSDARHKSHEPFSIKSQVARGATIEEKNSFNVSFNSGYFFTKLANETSNGVEGYRQFLYLDARKNAEKYTANVPKYAEGYTYVGLVVENREIYPKTTRYEDDLLSDSRLTVRDEGTGRVQYFFDGITYENRTDGVSGDISSLVASYDPRNCANITNSLQECTKCVSNSPAPPKNSGVNIECDTQIKNHQCWVKHNPDRKPESSPYCDNVLNSCGSNPLVIDAYAPHCRTVRDLSFSPVFYIDHLNKEVRYMNNLLIGKYS